MQAKFATAVLFGVALIALGACGGGGGDEAQLRTDLEAAQQAAVEAEEARKKAEEEAAEAERKRREAEDEAEQARLDAQAAEEAEAEAERLRQEEAAARLAAEAEQERLEAEAEKARQVAETERARVAISGVRNIGTTDPAGLLVGTIVHGKPAPVTTPSGPFTTTTGSSGRWSTTTHTANREATQHTIEIYSDIEAPERNPFRTSPLNTGTNVGPTGTTAVIDGTNMVVGWVNIVDADHGRIASAGAFPRDSGPPEPFSLVDRGLTQSDYSGLGLAADGSATDAELDTAGITRQQYNQYRADRGFRDTDDFPQRYAYTTSGQLQGAGGTYRCSGADTSATCTVQNQGGSFAFGGTGDWDFIPSSGTVQIVVPDAHYMWFGWWAQRTVEHPTPDHPTDIWAFEANHGGNAVTTLTAATGPATYRGPAAGRYAVYEPDTGDSGIGSFTASATLQADFDTDMVSGSITGFSNDPSWSLALKRSSITGGNVGVATDGVTWTIDNVPDDSGAWEATFYADLETDTGTITYQPHGIAGTFEAAYDPSGVGARAALIGAFGAHR